MGMPVTHKVADYNRLLLIASLIVIITMGEAGCMLFPCQVLVLDCRGLSVLAFARHLLLFDAHPGRASSSLFGGV